MPSNLSVNWTPGKLSLPVPFALLAPVAGYLKRQRINMRRIIYSTVLTFIVTSVNAAPISEAQMSARVKESLARDSAYEMLSVKAFWGNAAFMAECAHENMPLPAPFTIYFEVLPDGRLGQLLFSPLTDVGRCIQAHVAGRRFSKPPGGAYVTKIEMSFAP